MNRHMEMERNQLALQGPSCDIGSLSTRCEGRHT